MTITAVLLAAGRGRRMGREVNKVLLAVAGVPIVSHAAAALGRIRDISELVVVAHPDELGAIAAALPPLDIPVRVIEGGAERQDSSLAGVSAASGEFVLVHDAARPFPCRSLIDRVIAGMLCHDACIPVVREVDTLRRVDAAGFAAAEVVDRTSLVRVQTPQGFRTELLRNALRAWEPGALLCDDAAAVLAQGRPVAVVEGDVWNLKITTPEDLDSALRLATCHATS